MDAYTSILTLLKPNAPLPRHEEGRAETPDIESELIEHELGAHYQVVRALGRGAVGAVYLARDLALHRHVAIKVLRSDLLGDRDARERFRREARMSAQLSHPNIVPLYTFGETASLMYMVMKYVHGESLGERLARLHVLPPTDVRRILSELALAMHCAHGQGVVHRDLKPENVLIDRDNERAMLADFGVATLRSWDPRPGEIRCVFGTPHFMSPEQAAGELDLDGRSDVYALGVLGYLMLTGTVPFEGRSYGEIAAKHVTAPLPSLLARAPRTPRDLVATIERCLEKDAANRFRSARELNQALVEGSRSGSLFAWARLAAIVASVSTSMAAIFSR